MDFKRIQIIFLITFVIIDIFLFSLFHRNQSVQTSNINASNSTHIVSEMRNEQISFRHSPSNRIRNGYYIAAKKDSRLPTQLKLLRKQDFRYANRQLVSSFKQPVVLNTRHPHTTINHLLKKKSFVPFGRQYRYSYDLSNANTLVYVQKIHHSHQDDIFSPTSELRFHTNGRLLNGYTQHHVSDIQNLREKSETISARRAITLLYQYNNIPNGTKIRWCHFAYTLLLSVKGNYVYIPTWVIKMKTSDHSVRYRKMNAFNGSIITQNSQLQNNSNRGALD